MLTYEKPVMKLSELMAMGFPEEMLLNAYRTKGQQFAQKMNPGKKNSPIIFMTEEFERWREKIQQEENRSLYQKRGVV